MTPEDAELQYLDNARKLPLYGVDLHQAVVCNISFCANELKELKGAQSQCFVFFWLHTKSPLDGRKLENNSLLR